MTFENLSRVFRSIFGRFPVNYNFDLYNGFNFNYLLLGFVTTRFYKIIDFYNCTFHRVFVSFLSYNTNYRSDWIGKIAQLNILNVFIDTVMVLTASFSLFAQSFSELFNFAGICPSFWSLNCFPWRYKKTFQ